VMDPAELARRLEHLLRAHMTRIALASARARVKTSAVEAAAAARRPLPQRSNMS
jgi:hypothetical protein